MKQVIFLGNSYRRICEFPSDAKRETGFQIHYVQSGVNPDDWKPMPSIGLGVKEIRIHLNNEYRIIYTANYHNTVYVLHAFVKKMQKMSKKDLQIAKHYFNEIKRLER